MRDHKNTSRSHNKDTEYVDIPHGTDFNNEDFIAISENEIVHDIWLFQFEKGGNPCFKGIYRDGVINKLRIMGYYKRFKGNNSCIFIKEQDSVIWEVNPSIMKDEFFTKAMNDIEFEYNGKQISVLSEKLRETYLNQHHLIFNDKFIEHLSTHVKPIFRDTKDESFYYFKNTIIKVTKNGFEQLSYEDVLFSCIWRSQIIEHDFEYLPENKNCHFAKFIHNVCNGEDDRKNALKTAIGYLLHNYSDPSKGQAVIALDEEITDLKNPMGGTGKGIVGNGIKQLRDVVKVDGKKFDSGDKFRYQDITDRTQVAWFDDVKPEINFDSFNSVLTDGWSIEKKYQAQFYIKPEDSPKMYLTSNSVLCSGGSTSKRRQFIVEFSDHYSRQIKKGIEEPVKSEHGCTFFDKTEWNKEEWDMFFSYMVDCVTLYMQQGLIYCEPKSVHRNRLIQATSREFYSWVERQEFKTGVRCNTKDKLDDFVGSTGYTILQRGFSNWLKVFADSQGWEFEAKTSNSVQYFSFHELRS